MLGGLDFHSIAAAVKRALATLGTTLGDLSLTGSLSVAGATTFSGVLSPAQITANTNNYAPVGLATAAVLRLTTDASRNLTSIADGTNGRVIKIVNVGSFNLVLRNDDGATGTAANRFQMGGDVVLYPDQSATLHYDGTTSR